MICEPSLLPIFIKPILDTRQEFHPSMNFLEPIRMLIVELVSEMPWNKDFVKLSSWIVRSPSVSDSNVFAYLGTSPILMTAKYWSLVFVFSPISPSACFTWKASIFPIPLNILVSMVSANGLSFLKYSKCPLKISLPSASFNPESSFKILLMSVCKAAGDERAYLKNLTIRETSEILSLSVLVRLLVDELITLLPTNTHRGFSILYTRSSFWFLSNNSSCSK